MSPPNDDSDLEDLIAKGGGSSRRNKRANLEIDSNAAQNNFFLMTPCYCITGSFRLFCYKCPCLSKCILALMSIGIISFLSYTLFSPYQQMGIMGADYSAITSAYDLSLSKVDHWCIQGDNDSCKCEDPLEPNSRQEFKSWNAAHKANVADVSLYRSVYGEDPTMIDEATGKPRHPIDVAFLGESVVEAMDGRWLGKRVVRMINKRGEGEQEGNKNKPDIGKVFERMFRKDKGGPVEGVALGIAGDVTANVLWRLQHEEMPYDFNPKVWWLVLGMNDLTRMQCSEEIVVLGILRIVEEIRLRKPDAKIVINSLLPMIDYQSMTQPKMSDVADFKREKDAVRESQEIEKGIKQFFGGKDGSAMKNSGGSKPSGFKEHGYGRLRRFLRSRPKRRSGPPPRSWREKMTKRKRQEEEDNATEGVNLEKALERKKKVLEKKDKRMRDREFKDDEKYRPKKPISPFIPMIKKKVLPPVWPAVHLINEKLKEFSSKHESITFFDATAVFASDEGGGRHHLHNELISPRGHPSELGFAVWEGRIMGKLHLMLKEQQQAEIEKIAERERDEPEDDDNFDDDDQGKGNIVEQEEEEERATPKVDDKGKEISKDEEGSHHVSDGKENEPPKLEQQRSRAPPPEENNASDEKEFAGKRGDADDDEEEEEEEEEEDEKPKKVIGKVTTITTPKKEEVYDDDNGRDSYDEENEPEKKASTQFVRTKPEADDDDEEEDDDEDDDEKR